MNFLHCTNNNQVIGCNQKEYPCYTKLECIRGWVEQLTGENIEALAL